MNTPHPSRFVGRATLLAGITSFAGLILLVLFYMLEAPQIMAEGQPDRPPLFGSLNDASFVIVGLLLIPAALHLYKRTRGRAPLLAALAAVCGLVGLAGMIVTQTLFVLGVLTVVQQGPIISIIFGLIGLWLGFACLASRGEERLRGRVYWLGIVVGLGMLALPITYFAAGGADFANNPEAGMPGLPAMVGFVFTVLSSSIGWPLWMVWLGIDLLRDSSAPAAASVPQRA